jgi:hypothetical protein
MYFALVTSHASHRSVHAVLKDKSPGSEPGLQQQHPEPSVMSSVIASTCE